MCNILPIMSNRYSMTIGCGSAAVHEMTAHIIQQYIDLFVIRCRVTGK